MSTDVTAASSAVPQEAADLFYKTDPTPQAESTPALEQHSAPASKEVSETASASEAETTNTEESESTDQKPARTNAEKRIQQLLAENKRLKSERENPPQRIEATRADTPKVEASKAEQAPEPGQFNTWAEYQTAHSQFTERQIAKHVQSAIERDRQEQTRLQSEREQQDAFATQKQAQLDRVKEAESRHADFKAKVFELDEAGKVAGLRSDLQLHPVVDNFIPQSKVGMELLYHFATNPQEAARFLKLEPYDALREAIALEATLTQGLTNPPTKTRLKPPTTVNGKSGGAPKPRSAEEVLYGAD